MLEFFVIKEVREPRPEFMDAIVAGICRTLESHHGVPTSPEARSAAIELTSRYHVKELDRAQPTRAKLLIESAITNYRRAVHSRPQALRDLEQRLENVVAALAGARPAPELEGSTRDVLEGRRRTLEADREQLLKQWEAFQLELRNVYRDQRAAEIKVFELENEIEAERERIAEEAKRRAEEAGAKALQGESGEERARARFRSRLAGSGLESETVAQLEGKKREWQALLEKNRSRYQSMTAQLNRDLLLGADHVYEEFSKLSGIDVRRLKEDEATKLLELDATLASRVFGQPEPVAEVARAVRRGRTGLKKQNKPIGSFIFLGPTGVGKTELAKALAAALFGDDSTLRVYDMSEYQEKHAVSALIGAPPGYEGYEYGGVLTNNMRKHPRCVNVFDEIEKAHKDIFDLFLQIVDEGRLTDRRGLVASFADSVNILTSNIGQPYFLDESLSFEEAKERALADLWDPRKGGYRAEFLARFTGIFCFNRLSLSTIETIAAKGLATLNDWIEQPDLRVEMEPRDLAAMCKDHYDPARGARSILIGWVENKIASEVAEVILRNPQQRGAIRVGYDSEAKEIRTSLAADAPAAQA
jgi:ATP-dependent Clp protease ATP-binding subunit ClpB